MAIITAPVAHDTHRKPLYAQLYFQVLTAIALGIALGHFYPEIGTALKPLGDAFIKLVKMIIAPVIFLTVTTGIASMHDLSLAARWCSRLILLDKGVILADGPPREVLTAERLRAVYAVETFLGEAGGKPIVLPLDLTR